MKKQQLLSLALGSAFAVAAISPVIAANPDFELVAVSSLRGVTVPGVSHVFRDWRALLAEPNMDCVAICTPPQVRHQIAREALVVDEEDRVGHIHRRYIMAA